MRRGLSHVGKALLGLAVFTAIAVYWLFYDNRPPSSGRFPLDIAAIRSEAARIPGDRPSRLEVEIVTHSMLPKITMVAGSSWSKADQIRTSYRLVFPSSSIIVDTAYDPKTAAFYKVDRYDMAAWQRLLTAMDQATQIVVTHEHNDHLGGLMASPNAKALLAKSRLTPEQVTNIQALEPLKWPEGSRTDFKPLIYDKLLAIAPGVVLIKAKGHTPGSQMVYVQRADGQEYIFMGDTASAAGNVVAQHIRSRLVTDFYTHENRAAVFLQTKALHDLSVAQPKIALIPGHDAAAIEAMVKKGLLHRGFTPHTP